jgi:hypothetical protein
MVNTVAYKVDMSLLRTVLYELEEVIKCKEVTLFISSKLIKKPLRFPRCFVSNNKSYIVVTNHVTYQVHQKCERNNYCSSSPLLFSATQKATHALVKSKDILPNLHVLYPILTHKVLKVDFLIFSYDWKTNSYFNLGFNYIKLIVNYKFIDDLIIRDEIFSLMF